MKKLSFGRLWVSSQRAVVVVILASVLLTLIRCSHPSGTTDVFVGLPQLGEGWVWQTFRPPGDSTLDVGDSTTLVATFTLMTYGEERTVRVVLAYYYPDHSGLEHPIGQEWRTFTTDILDSNRVDYEFKGIELTSRGHTPFAFYFFIEGPVTCDLLAYTSLDYADVCLRVQDRYEKEPTVVGNAYFTVRRAALNGR